MATITKRGPYQYQAIVRRVGFPTQTATFETKRDARDWASTVESEMRRGMFVDRSEAERTTWEELLARYAEEVTPLKRGATAERSRLKRLMAHPLALRRLTQLRAADFAAYRDERLEAGLASKTVREELLLCSAVLNTARLDWSIPVENYAANLRKPSPGQHRERRLVGNEEQRVLAECECCHSVGLDVAVILAIETGMRRGEIAGLAWDQVDLAEHVVRLTVTKNGDRRTVPLSERAEAALLRLPRRPDGRLFGFHDANGLGIAFARACRRAGIHDLRFHDLRHEVASRLAPHMPAGTLAKIMGWRTIQMAMRYYNPMDRELVVGFFAPLEPECQRMWFSVPGHVARRIPQRGVLGDFVTRRFVDMLR